ncbi:endodeoxyribonuclease [Mactra antiquata]
MSKLILRLGISDTSLMPLTKSDRDRGVTLLTRPYMFYQPLWRKEPQDCGYFHVVKQKVADMAMQLGYMGVKTRQRGVFPKLLHQVLNRITGATVAAAFKCTGIVPIDKTAVAALLQTRDNTPDPVLSTTCASADLSVPPPVTQCSECGNSTQNPS